VAGKYKDESVQPFLQSLQALAIPGQPALAVNDILDWASLLQKLNNPTQAGAGQRIWSLLGADVQQVIQQVAATPGKVPTEAQKTQIIAALNGVLLRSDFYLAPAFASLTIPVAVKNLLQAGTVLSQDEVEKLNRLLLEAAYPQEIVKSAVRQIDDEWKEKLNQQLATFVGSTPERVTALMEVVAKLLPPPAGVHNYVEAFFNQDTASQQHIRDVLKALSRGLVLAEKLQLKSSEIDSVRVSPTSYGLPTSLQPITINNLKSLFTFKQLTIAFQDTQDQLCTFFASPSASAAGLAAITGWTEGQINEVMTNHYFQNGTSLLTTVAGISMLKKVFDLNAAIGVDFSFHDQILPLATVSAQDKWQMYIDAVSKISNTVKAKYNDDDWLKITSTINSTLNETKRDALAGFVLWSLGLKNLRALSEYLLIDVETTGCASISIIKQALLSVQMYLQRCRLNLEPGVNVINIPDTWWEWMMNYRIWEANRKVFLYPENYIDPGLRTNSCFCHRIH
jgi:hypothetical protein